MKIEKFDHIFLDRDGVINEVVFRGDIVSSPQTLEEFSFKQDIKEFINRFNKKKEFYVITNQPDISRGLLDPSELEKMHKMISSELGIEKISYCPHTKEDGCNFRKPKPGMINKYIFDLKLDKAKCLMIGDTENDALAAKNSNISSVLIRTAYNSHLGNIHFVNSLKDLI